MSLAMGGLEGAEGSPLRSSSGGVVGDIFLLTIKL